MLTPLQKRIKRSVDLDPQADAAVKATQEKFPSYKRPSIGALLSSLANDILGLNETNASRLLRAVTELEDSCRLEHEDIPGFEEMRKRDSQLQIERLDELRQILSIVAGPSQAIEPMRRIRMSGKSILVPDDPSSWVVVNEDYASQSDEAIIVEVRNGKRYGIPHFIFFDDSANKKGEREIDEAISRVYPQYRQTVINNRVTPKYDSTGKLINADEWARSPATGYFPAGPNDPVHGNPYGIEIIPDS